jgi:hypothetical protein
VAYNRRPQRRPGIRYGPPREKERYTDTGVLIGRLLGLGVLLLTVGVLAAGALAFMGDLPGSSRASRSPTSVAANPSTLESASIATPIPSRTPFQPLPTPSTMPSTPSPAPTIVPPLVQIGPGYVTFGTHADRTLKIVDPQSVFDIGQRITWSAYLSEIANSEELNIQILKLDNEVIGGETLISDEPVTPLVTGAQLFQQRIRPQQDLSGPGLYVVRYLRNTDILSEGFFLVTGQEQAPETAPPSATPGTG